MKKFLIFCLVLGAAVSYVYTHYNIDDVASYAQKKADPKWSPMIEYFVGFYYEQKERYPDAEKTLENMLETFPENEYKGKAVFRLGECYEAERNIPKAKELYEKYLADNPNGEFSELTRRKLEILKSN
jgi:tetratricopeptide (TPR) repeat protein